MQGYHFNKLWWFFGILGLTLIAYGSFMPSDPGSQPFVNFDKLVHFTGYGIACFYFQQLTKNQKIILILVLIFLYSGLIEVIQHNLPTREMSVMDLIANGLGCLFGSLLSTRVLKDFLKNVDQTLSDQMSR